MLNQVQHDGSSLGQSFYATTSNLLHVPVEGSLLAKEVPVLRWGEVFLLPQTIRSLRLSKGLVCKEVPVLRWGKVFLLTQNNPLPEALEGSLCAKETTALRQAQGPCCGTYNAFRAKFKNRKPPALRLCSVTGGLFLVRLV